MTIRFLPPDDLRQWNPAGAVTAAVLLSAVFAAAFFTVWPCPYIFDDGGIVVKYMDCFAEGAFYRYNVSDGPVFGVSGFLHGILSGALAWSHLLSPERSVLASNCLGVALTSLAILLILRTFSDSCSAIILAWLVTLTGSTYFIRTAFQGLETPLHLAVVLFTFWACLSNRGRVFWLFCALAVISKLDAVPIVAILGLVRVAETYVRDRSVASVLRELRDAFLWAGIPLIGWLAFAHVTFGSALPQTAYAKMQFRVHPPGRFAFLAAWCSERGTQAYLAAAFALAAGCLFLRRNVASKSVIFAAAACGELALYCVFNPEEQMPWYHVLPQTLLVLAVTTAMLSIYDLALREEHGRLRVAVCLLFIVLLPFNMTLAIHYARNTIAYVYSTEPERVEVGKWIRAVASPGDRLFASHGHTARYAHLYTYDLSGLNSPIITDLWKQNKSPLDELRPEWVAGHSFLSEAEQGLGYGLAASFYDVSLTGYRAWRVWKKEPQRPGCSQGIARKLAYRDVAADGEVKSAGSDALHASGSRIVLRSPESDTAPQALLFGIARQSEPFNVDVGLISSKEPRKKLTPIAMPARDAANLAPGLTGPCRVQLPPDTPSQVEIVLTLSPGKHCPKRFELLEPVWIMGPAKTAKREKKD
jgi:hypothetical protein